MENCSIDECVGEVYENQLCEHHYDLEQEGSSHRRKIRARNKVTRSAIVTGDIARIPLGVNAKDGYAIVDADDASLAHDFTWCVDSGGYVVTRLGRTNESMHRMVMGFPDYMIDHVNRNKLDNRTANLRPATHSQNALNTTLRTNNTSGFKGVSKVRDKWHASIRINGKVYSRPGLSTKYEAAKAYNELAIRYGDGYILLNDV